jgi:hypothetical protein
MAPSPMEATRVSRGSDVPIPGQARPGPGAGSSSSESPHPSKQGVRPNAKLTNRCMRQCLKEVQAASWKGGSGK